MLHRPSPLVRDPSMDLAPQHPRLDRMPLVRPVSYEVLSILGDVQEEHHANPSTGTAVLLNISQGGMLLLTANTLSLQGHLLVNHASLLDVVALDTLIGEVVWTCPLFLAPELHFVGVRFIQ